VLMDGRVAVAYTDGASQDASGKGVGGSIVCDLLYRDEEVQ